MSTATISLRDHFLIAMPELQSPYFAKSVTYICEHTREGAMGLIINHPLSLSFIEVLQNMGMNTTTDPEKIDNNLIYAGGPIQQDRGFILHPPHGEWEVSFPLNEHLSLTTSRDILKAIAEDKGPERYLLALGYAAWSKGQLEQEIAENAWLWVPATLDILFDLPWLDRWKAAATRLGVSMELLSPEVGHA